MGMNDEQSGERLPVRTEFLLYKTEDGRVRVQTRLEDETVWLSINQMSDLLGVDKSGISRHLRTIYDTGELRREATVAKYATVQREGAREVTRHVEHFNLDDFLKLSGRDILTHAGTISHDAARGIRAIPQGPARSTDRG